MSCAYCGNECGSGGCCKTCGNATVLVSRTACAEETVIDSRGGCVHVARGEDLVNDCTPAQCGDMTIKSPGFLMTITNPANLLLQEDTGELILENDGMFFTVD